MSEDNRNLLKQLYNGGTSEDGGKSEASKDDVGGKSGRKKKHYENLMDAKRKKNKSPTSVIVSTPGNDNEETSPRHTEDETSPSRSKDRKSKKDKSCRRHKSSSSRHESKHHQHKRRSSKEGDIHSFEEDTLNTTDLEDFDLPCNSGHSKDNKKHNKPESKQHEKSKTEKEENDDDDDSLSTSDLDDLRLTNNSGHSLGKSKLGMGILKLAQGDEISLKAAQQEIAVNKRPADNHGMKTGLGIMKIAEGKSSLENIKTTYLDNSRHKNEGTTNNEEDRIPTSFEIIESLEDDPCCFDYDFDNDGMYDSKSGESFSLLDDLGTVDTDSENGSSGDEDPASFHDSRSSFTSERGRSYYSRRRRRPNPSDRSLESSSSRKGEQHHSNSRRSLPSRHSPLENSSSRLNDSFSAQGEQQQPSLPSRSFGSSSSSRQLGRSSRGLSSRSMALRRAQVNMQLSLSDHRSDHISDRILSDHRSLDHHRSDHRSDRRSDRRLSSHRLDVDDSEKIILESETQSAEFGESDKPNTDRKHTKKAEKESKSNSNADDLGKSSGHRRGVRRSKSTESSRSNTDEAETLSSNRNAKESKSNNADDLNKPSDHRRSTRRRSKSIESLRSSADEAETVSSDRRKHKRSSKSKLKRKKKSGNSHNQRLDADNAEKHEKINDTKTQNNEYMGPAFINKYYASNDSATASADSSSNGKEAAPTSPNVPIENKSETEDNGKIETDDAAVKDASSNKKNKSKESSSGGDASNKKTSASSKTSKKKTGKSLGNYFAGGKPNDKPADAAADDEEASVFSSATKKVKSLMTNIRHSVGPTLDMHQKMLGSSCDFDGDDLDLFP